MTLQFKNRKCCTKKHNKKFSPRKISRWSFQGKHVNTTKNVPFLTKGKLKENFCVHNRYRLWDNTYLSVVLLITFNVWFVYRFIVLTHCMLAPCVDSFLREIIYFVDIRKFEWDILFQKSCRFGLLKDKGHDFFKKNVPKLW